MYGTWFHGFDEVVRPFVEGRIVWALGSGTDEAEAEHLERCGAAGVILVDKHDRRLGPAVYRVSSGQRTLVWAYFHELDAIPELEGIPRDVALVKWPRESDPGGHLSRLLQSFPCVIYIGKNDGWTACGSPQFWRDMQRRLILAAQEYRTNDLIVFGAP